MPRPQARSSALGRAQHPWAPPTPTPAVEEPGLDGPADETASQPDSKSTTKTRPGDDDLVIFSARIPKGLQRRVKSAAVDNDTSQQAIVVEALEAWLRSQA